VRSWAACSPSPIRCASCTTASLAAGSTGCAGSVAATAGTGARDAAAHRAAGRYLPAGRRLPGADGGACAQRRRARHARLRSRVPSVDLAGLVAGLCHEPGGARRWHAAVSAASTPIRGASALVPPGRWRTRLPAPERSAPRARAPRPAAARVPVVAAQRRLVGGDGDGTDRVRLVCGRAVVVDAVDGPAADAAGPAESCRGPDPVCRDGCRRAVSRRPLACPAANGRRGIGDQPGVRALLGAGPGVDPARGGDRHDPAAVVGAGAAAARSPHQAVAGASHAGSGAGRGRRARQRGDGRGHAVASAAVDLGLVCGGRGAPRRRREPGQRHSGGLSCAGHPRRDHGAGGGGDRRRRHGPGHETRCPQARVRVALGRWARLRRRALAADLGRRRATAAAGGLDDCGLPAAARAQRPRRWLRRRPDRRCRADHAAARQRLGLDQRAFPSGYASHDRCRAMARAWHRGGCTLVRSTVSDQRVGPLVAAPVRRAEAHQHARVRCRRAVGRHRHLAVDPGDLGAPRRDLGRVRRRGC
jgi:hypothetical protein